MAIDPIDWSKGFGNLPGYEKAVETSNIIQDMIEQKVLEMKQACDEECRKILISRGIASVNFTPYQWKRLGKLLETRGDGITYYFGERNEVKVYQVTYYEPPMPGWGSDRNPTDPYTVQLGSFQVLAL